MEFDSHKVIRREVADMHANAIKMVKRVALLVLLSQLLGCGDDFGVTASSASEVKQLTEGQVTGIDSPFDGAITVFADCLTLNHRWVTCDGRRHSHLLIGLA